VKIVRRVHRRIELQARAVRHYAVAFDFLAILSEGRLKGKSAEKNRSLKIEVFNEVR